jgi:hypothetical protein
MLRTTNGGPGGAGGTGGRGSGPAHVLPARGLLVAGAGVGLGQHMCYLRTILVREYIRPKIKTTQLPNKDSREVSIHFRNISHLIQVHRVNELIYGLHDIFLAFDITDKCHYILIY